MVLGRGSVLRVESPRKDLIADRNIVENVEY